MKQNEWEAAVWATEAHEISEWIENLRTGNGCQDIRIVTPESCDITTTIISDATCGDAYVITTDLTGETIDQAVQGRWYPESVTKAISELYLAANSSLPNETSAGTAPNGEAGQHSRP